MRALHDPLLSPEEMQEQLERDCATVSIARQRTQHLECLKRTGGISQEASVNTVILKWQHKFASVIEKLREQPESLPDHESLAKEEVKQPDQTKLTNSLFLSLLEPLEAKVIAILAIRQLMRVNEHNVEMNGYPMASLARSIGDALQNEIFAIQILDKTFQKMTSLRYIQSFLIITLPIDTLI